MAIRLTGILRRGLGEATGFTGLDWVRAAFRDTFGLDLHPGTVNLALETDEARGAWAAIKAGAPVVIEPPDPAFCDAHCYRARILAPAGGTDSGTASGATIEAVIVLPAVEGYPADKVELVAPVAVRDAFGLAEGDPVTVEVSQE